jgi:hypothetical protein
MSGQISGEEQVIGPADDEFFQDSPSELDDVQSGAHLRLEHQLRAF